jgi:predicted dehydrogenase
VAANNPRALVVGTVFGARVQVPALRAAGFDVAGLVGTDAARTAGRAEASGVAGAFTDLDEAIDGTAATLVAIATPPHTHHGLVMRAIARGCNILCEKPFARDAGEGREMLEAARRAGVVHMVGHEFRWTPEQALAARALAEGVIGEPRFATFVHYLPFLGSQGARMPDWWFDKQAGGGWLGASGSHGIDQVRMWLGEFATLSAALPIVAAHGTAEDSFAVRFQLANGVEGVLQQTGAAWGPSCEVARVAGAEGALWLEGGGVWVADAKGTRRLPMPAELVLPTPTADDPPPHMIALYTRLCEHLRAVLDGRAGAAAMPTPTFADGVACMQVLDAVRASAANAGALVRIGPAAG